MYISGDNPCLSCILNNPQKIREIFINSEKSNIYKQLIEKHKLNGITKYLPKKELLKIDKEDKRSSNDIIIRRDKYTSVSLGEIVSPKTKNSLIILLDQLYDQYNLGNIIAPIAPIVECFRKFLLLDISLIFVQIVERPN